MASFVFNNFKKRFIEGKIPSVSDWYFIPVNNNFKSNAFSGDNVSIENYRNLEDFKLKSYSDINYTLNENNEIVSIDENSDAILKSIKIEREWYKILDDGDLSTKPIFIDNTNFSSFKKELDPKKNIHLNTYLNMGGFYLIRSKDELNWFANRSNSGNNNIIGVIGDVIEGVINGEPIGTKESYPFEGILDGNGYTFKNISIDVSNTNNGIIGVLGKHGIIRNIRLENTNNINSLVCNKKINLDYIKKESQDINAGILVGLNYGTIENIDGLNLGYFKFSGFIPEVYSVTNKSDKYSWSDGKVRKKFDDTNENFYYLNSWCINSPGNVCPYVGYFAEGQYGDDIRTVIRYSPYLVNNSNNALFSATYIDGSSAFDTDTYTYNSYNSIMLNAGINGKSVIGTTQGNCLRISAADNCLLEFNYHFLNNYCYQLYNYLPSRIIDKQILTNTNTAARDIIFNEENTTIKDQILEAAKLPLYYGLDTNGHFTCGVINGCNSGMHHSVVSDVTVGLKIGYGVSGYWSADNHSYSANSSGLNNVCYNTNIIAGIDGNGITSATYCPSAYCQTTMRMNPIARAAYNIGVIAGANFGKISNIAIKTTAQNTSNFVGFIGGIAGKQGEGVIDSIEIDITNDFIYNGDDNSYKVTYKNTPILPPKLRNGFTDYYYSESITKNKSNLDLMFSAFYEEQDEYTITQDCVTYKLNPIFIAGGLFGRYIPTFNIALKDTIGDGYLYKGLNILNSKVEYSDNFTTTKDDKRIENAMGVIAGKIDYATTNIGISENEIMNESCMKINNCQFHSNTDVGDYILTRKFSFVIDSNCVEHFEHDLKIDGETTSFYDGICNTKYIGVYELKYNACDSITLGLTNSGFKEFSENQVELSGHDTGYLYACDYPLAVTLSSCGDKATLWTLEDFNQYETSANPGLTIPNGFNKRNIAANLIQMYNCTTNISPAVVLYDDFYNDWEDFADYEPNGGSAHDWCINIPHTHKAYEVIIDDKKYAKDIYKVLAYNKTTISEDDDNPVVLQIQELKGIQNTFDGYTWADSKIKAAYSNVDYNAWVNPPSTMSDINSTPYEGLYKTNTADSGEYYNPRIWTKNKRLHVSTYLTPMNKPLTWDFYNEYGINPTLTYNDNRLIIDNNVISAINLFNGKSEDKYYYYDCKETYSEEKCNIIKENVTFTGDIVTNIIGYIRNNKADLNKNYGYVIGEDLTSDIIIKRLNDTNSFTTTSLSSKEDFGGLLVVDTSGNNIMFLDNVNNVPLTGNNVKFNLNTISLNNNNSTILIDISNGDK